ncbi:MAG: alcohol dehydrogenase catalytic domain-containing protein [Gemmatimonadetes bacterium]|nr:alcohol dehydrogenase catalytic domain-containing protein [Gemmatimonadota bacterium]
MKAVVFRAIEEVEVDDVDEPRVETANDVVVEVEAAGLCGSDLHPYYGREVGLDPGTVMGHEFVGRVVEVGTGVRTLSAGDRVVAPFTTSCGYCLACSEGLTARCERGQLFGWVQDGAGLHGGQAARVRVPLADGTLVRVPDAMDAALALLAGDILSTALFGCTMAAVGAGSRVGVVGCGPVGLMTIRAAFSLGAETVYAVDRVASRLEWAGALGARALHLDDDPAGAIRRQGGRGADAVIEAVGGAGATRTAADLVRTGGRIAAVGVHTEPHLAISPGEIYDRNLTYAGGRCPARHFLPRALELAAADAALLSGLITHRLPLDAAPEAYRAFGERREGWGKVVFTP